LALGSFTSDGAAAGAMLPDRALTFPTLISLAQRMGTLALLFVSELIVLSVWLDGASLSVTGLSGFMRSWGSPILRGIVGFAAVFATFAYLKSKGELKEISARLAHTFTRWRFLVAHACAMAAFAALSSVLYGKGLYAGRASEFWANPLAIMWFAAGISAIAFGALAFLPWTAWSELIRCTGHLWAFAGMAVFLAAVLGKICQRLWQPASVLTFSLTKLVLSPFLSTVIAHPERMVIGTPAFRVQISPECSGLEGVGLIVSFGILWLLVFRRECRFPRSLLLIPLGAVLAYLVNVLRLAALVLIGNAGAPHIAAGGFHSQAGWIAFSALSVGFCLVSQQVPWFTT
jgi:exosortase/archaeosortase family protein